MDLFTFLFRLHEAKRMGPCSYEFERSYAAKVVLQLERKGTISREESVHFLGLFELWIDSLLRLQEEEAIIHGDATPTNFIFPAESEVVAIDLERMRVGDPLYDLGMLCGEIKHAFLWRKGDWFSSEPFIRAFLESYCEKKETRTGPSRS